MTRKPAVVLALLSISAACPAADFSSTQNALGIPSSIATVVDASGAKPELILIQDVHRHPEAQDNIRAMVLHGIKHWGTRTVFLEGAWSPGKNQDFAYLGLEDEKLYRDNVAAYVAVDAIREEALRQLETAKMLSRIMDADAQPAWVTIKRLIQLRLKPAEYADYVKAPYRPGTDTTLAKATIAAEHFYELANLRSKVFIEKAKQGSSSGTKVLVVGGFHTQDMTAELRAKGVSYVVLSPKITCGGFEELYAQGLHETVSALKLR